MAKKTENNKVKRKPTKKYLQPLKIKDGAFNQVLKASGDKKEEEK